MIKIYHFNNLSSIHFYYACAHVWYTLLVYVLPMQAHVYDTHFKAKPPKGWEKEGTNFTLKVCCRGKIKAESKVELPPLNFLYPPLEDSSQQQASSRTTKMRRKRKVDTRNGNNPHWSLALDVRRHVMHISTLSSHAEENIEWPCNTLWVMHFVFGVKAWIV